MLFIVTPGDVLATVIICVAVLLVGIWQAHLLHLRRDLAILFAVSAIALALVRYSIEVGTPADAAGYYLNSLTGAEFDIGTDFMPFITALLSDRLQLGFLPAMMFFTLFSLMTVQLSYAIYLKVGGDTLWLRWQFGFLALVVPSIGFWGSGISKDSLVLFGLVAFCWGILKTPRSALWYGLGIVIVSVIRPHIGVVMLCSLGLAMLFGRGVRAFERVSIVTLGIVGTILVVPLAIDYIGFGNIGSLDDVSYRLEVWTQGYEDSDSYINISEMPLPLQIVTYLFRPFLWESGSLVQLVAALQNLVLLAMLVIGLPRLFSRRGDLRELPQLTFAIYSMIGLLLLATSTANLGIAVRQKWMVVLPLLFALTRALARSRQQMIEARATPPALPLVVPPALVEPDRP
jgi:hypothetical protein